MPNNSYQKHDVVVFKHFARKGYALYACLGKVVTIGVLSIATLHNAKAAGVSVDVNRANNDSIPTEREYDLDEFEVSGTRAPLSSGQAARLVTVLRAEDIHAAAVQSLNDLLKLCVGVDVRQRAPLGAQTDISIRGGTSEHIAILLNGVCISDPQTGHNTLDLPVQISEILRIEVLEGPAARVFGAQSLLGAINIITRQPSAKPGGEVSLSAGSFGSMTVGGVAVCPQTWGFCNSLSASYARSDGFSRDKNSGLNNDYEGDKLYYQGSYQLSNGGNQHADRLQWAFGHARKRWGSSTSYGLGSDSQYEVTDKYFGNICAELSLAPRLTVRPAAYWQQNNDRYYWRRGVSTPNRNTTNIYGASVNGFLDWLLGRSTLGVELRNEDLLSSNMPNTNRTNLSLHFEHNISYKQLSLSAGFMMLKNSFNNMPWKVYPGVDAACSLSKNWKLFASWNRSMRLPSYTELYYKVDGHLADPNLQPEEMEAIEGGIRYASKYGRASLSLYRHHGKNMIDWILDTNKGQDAVWTSVNHAQLTNYGTELQSRWLLTSLFPTQKVLKTFSLGYNYMYQKQEKEAHIQSLYALEYLRHKLTASLQACLFSGGKNHSKQLEVSLNYRFQDRIGEYTDAQGAKHTYAPYSTIDARLDWHSGIYNLYLTANNLLSKRYIDYGNVKQPGVWFTGGVKVKL